MKRKVVIALLGIGCVVSTAFAQSSFDTSPGAQTGEKVLGSYFATDIDTVSMTNGNLHLSVPLFSLPGREVPLHLSVDYNSKFFEQRQVPKAGGGTTTTWDFLGWRKNTGVGSTLTATFSTVLCGYGGSYNVDVYWIEWNGTKHKYSTTRASQYCPQPYDSNNLTFDSTESDLVRVQTGNYFSNPVVSSDSSTTWGTATITFKNGTRLLLSQRQVGPAPYQACDSDPPVCWWEYPPTTQETKWEFRTLNGNSLVAPNRSTIMFTTNSTALNDAVPLSDTAGRSIGYSQTTSGTTTTETFTLLDSNGSSKVYTITWNNIAARSPDNVTSLTIRAVTAIGLPNGRSYQFQYDGNGYLSTVTFPSGAYIRYTYWYPSDRASGWYVATRNVSSDGTSASEKTTSYTYTYQSPGDCWCWDAGPLVSTTVTDPTGGVTVHSFDTNNGLENNTQVKTASGTVLKQVQRTWQNGSLGWVVASETTTTGSYSYSNSFTYDSRNNTTSQTESEQGAPVRRIVRTFLNVSPYSDSHIWDRPTTEKILPYDPVGSCSQYDPDGNCQTWNYWDLPPVAQSSWQYDTLALISRSGTIPGWLDPGTAPRANVTAVQRWLNTTNSYLTATTQYDILGNAVTATDPGGHATQTDFADRFSDSISRNSFAYATRVTDAGGFYAQSTYDFNTGLVKQTSDSLSRVTSTTYDLMNRTTQINHPDGGQTNYSYDDVTPTTTETKKVDTAGNVGRVTYTFDKLYRVTRKQTADPAGDIYVDTQYDNKGRKWKTSNPYRSGETVVWTASTYDASDRPLVTTSPDSSTVQYSYTNNQTTVTDEAGNQRRYTYDRYGHMTRVEEPNPTLSTPLTTTYSYNAVGKMTQSNQSGQIRAWAFDSLGRMISQTLPESGTTTFSYNVDSLLTGKTDARGVTMTYGYNSVHKPTNQTYSDSTPSVTFQYDAANRRSQMTDGLGTVISGAPDIVVYAEQRFIVSSIVIA